VVYSSIGFLAIADGCGGAPTRLLMSLSGLRFPISPIPGTGFPTAASLRFSLALSIAGKHDPHDLQAEESRDAHGDGLRGIQTNEVNTTTAAASNKSDEAYTTSNVSLSDCVGIRRGREKLGEI
jgi:hypothetical protein